MLHRIRLTSLFFLVTPALVLACAGTVSRDGQGSSGETASPGPTATVSPPGPTATASPPGTALPLPPIVAVCVAADDTCEAGGDACCAGLHCADTGYGWGFCRPPEPSGAYCEEAAACQSGICHQYTCVDELPACVGIGVYCADGTPCCEGYCTLLGYAIESGTCAPFLAAGSECNDGGECQSGICELGVCAP